MLCELRAGWWAPGGGAGPFRYQNLYAYPAGDSLWSPKGVAESLGGDGLHAPAASRTGFAPCKINAPPLGDHNLGLIFLLPTFFHRKVGPRRRAVLTMPLQKAPPAEGEMKLRHGFCRQSLRLISFATSLCTREAFAVRRLQTIPRRAGVLAKPCKRLRPAARRPPTRPKIPLPAFISFAPGMHGPRKNRPTVFPLLRGRAPEFAGIRAEHLSDHGKSGKSPAVSGERFCWTGPVRPL